MNEVDAIRVEQFRQFKKEAQIHHQTFDRVVLRGR